MISKDFFLGHWKEIIRNKDLSPPFSKSIFLPLLHISINHEYINAIFDAKSRKAIIFQSVSTKAASSKGSDSRLHQLSFCLSTFQRGIGRIYLEIFQNIQKSATHDKISFLLEIVTICLFGDLFCCFFIPKWILLFSPFYICAVQVGQIVFATSWLEKDSKTLSSQSNGCPQKCKRLGSKDSS